MRPHAIHSPTDLTDRDLRALRIFRVVVEAGGMTAAERRVGLDRSALSRLVKGLEQRLGATICVRGPRGFRVTEFGRDVLAAAVSMDDAIDEVRSLLSRSRDVIRGELRVGLADNCLTNPDARIVHALRAFAPAAPAVDLCLEIGEPTGLLQSVQERRLHCCVSGAIRGDARLSYDPLFREEFRLYVRDEPDLPTLQTLVSRGFSLVARAQETNPVPAGIKRLGLRNGVRAKGLEAVATLIGTGAHVGLLPTHYAQSLTDRLPLVEVPGADQLVFTVEFSLVSKIDRQAGRALALFRRLMREAHSGRS